MNSNDLRQTLGTHPAPEALPGAKQEHRPVGCAFRLGKRYVAPEWLDRLPSDDPLAQGSRRDLNRLNTWMGNKRTMVRGLRAAMHGPGPYRLAELGAGDGRFAVRVAQALPETWRGTRLTMVDRQAAVVPATHQALRQTGWDSELVQSDVYDWSQRSGPDIHDAVYANLFLHHFTNEQLRDLFQRIGSISNALVAVEPRRSMVSLFFSHLVGCIGCNRVTRHDAPVSVRAGFAGHELSGLWPPGAGWDLLERPVGPFGHLFVARRRPGPSD